MINPLLRLKENYNFKKEKDDSWSFEYNKKKAFILNLTDPINIKIITPFIMRRDQLRNTSEIILQKLEEDLIEKSELNEFVKFSIEILGNLLDRRKMGSPEYFINTVYEDIKSKNDQLKLINILVDMITMINHSTNYHLSQFSNSKIEAIHNAYFEIVMKGITDDYMIDDIGKIQVLTRVEEDDPESQDKKYNLADMIPINREEI